MRRALSILLFIVGGWMLVAELMIAFLDLEPGLGDGAIVIGLCAVVSGIPLLLGAWASPGERWRELGLTILIATGVALFSGMSTALIVIDPGFKPFIPMMPKYAFAPAIGTVNLILVGGLGWLLYRRRTITGR